MISSIPYALYLGIILSSLIVGILRINRLDKSSKFILGLLAATFLSEFIADFLALKYRTNMAVYHIYAHVHLFLICMFFNESIPLFKQKNVGWIIGIVGISLGILNSMFLQPFSALNSYYLLLTGFLVISMSLFAFYTILDNDNVGALNNPNFWFSLILLFFWSTTYISWSLYEILRKKAHNIMPFVGNGLLLVSALTYLGFGLVFLFYPKRKASGG